MENGNLERYSDGVGGNEVRRSDTHPQATIHGSRSRVTIGEYEGFFTPLFNCVFVEVCKPQAHLLNEALRVRQENVAREDVLMHTIPPSNLPVSPFNVCVRGYRTGAPPISP
ncbi:hypothetical protein ABIA20_001336 [Sinorhizobium fredii]